MSDNFDVALLGKFTDELSQELMSQAVLGGKTLDLVSVIPGIKYKSALNLLINSICVRPGSCGFTPYGDVNFDQRDVEVKSLKLNDELCFKTLEAYWIGQKMDKGSPKTDKPLGQILAQTYIEQIQKWNEAELWLGTYGAPRVTGCTTGSFNGFITTITAEPTRVALTYSALTVSNIVSYLDNMVLNIPQDALGQSDLTLFMSYGNYMTYVQGLRNLNLYNFSDTGKMGADYSCTIPGTSIKVEAMAGLNGSTALVLTPSSNLVVGTDLVSEEDKLKIWYSEDNDITRVLAQWKLGTQVRWPDWIVTNF